jgi:hypothetical protein
LLATSLLSRLETRVKPIRDQTQIRLQEFDDFFDTGIAVEESERTYAKQQKKKILIVQLDSTPVLPLLANIQTTRHSDILTTTADILRGLGIHEAKLEG